MAKNRSHPQAPGVPHAGKNRHALGDPYAPAASRPAGSDDSPHGASRAPAAGAPGRSPLNRAPPADVDPFEALAGLRDALRNQAKRRVRARREAAREAQMQARAAGEFRREMQNVIPLAVAPRASSAPSRPPPLPLQTRLDEQAALAEALSDEFDPEAWLDTDESLSYHRPGMNGDVVRRLRRGDWTIQAQIDLHGLRRDEAREALAAFLRDAAKRGLRCVRVIHGKGLGSIGKTPVLKGKVRAWLVQKTEVLAFAQARPHDGGGGAVVVLLQAGRRL